MENDESTKKSEWDNRKKHKEQIDKKINIIQNKELKGSSIMSW